MPRRTVVHVAVEDVEKRRTPSKHYVYVIYVTWSNGTTNVVFRRYSKFFALQNRLLDAFPEESGSHDPARRIVPFLPGKILFGRSHIRDVALKRLWEINLYCKNLISLPPKISQCDDVLEFFEVWPQDVEPAKKRATLPRHQNRSEPMVKSGLTKTASSISAPLVLEQYTAIADYKKCESNEVNLESGQIVDVIEKNQIGWWFVSTDEAQGWAPSAYLEKADGEEDDRKLTTRHSGHGERFLCQRAYTAENDDELSLEMGCMVDVIERNLDGWWLVRFQGRTGYAPGINLIRADTLKAMRILSNQTRFGSQDNTPGLKRQGSVPNLTKPVASQPKPKYSDDACIYENVNVQVGKPQAGNLLIKPNSQLLPPPQETKAESPISDRRAQPPPRKSSVSKAPPRPAPPKLETAYITIHEFQSQASDGITFNVGQIVKVIEKRSKDWWYIQIEDKEGWAPANCISVFKVGQRHSNPSAADKETITHLQAIAGAGRLGTSDQSVKPKKPKPPRPPAPKLRRFSSPEIVTSSLVNRNEQVNVGLTKLGGRKITCRPIAIEKRPTSSFASGDNQLSGNSTHAHSPALEELKSKFHQIQKAPAPQPSQSPPQFATRSKLPQAGKFGSPPSSSHSSLSSSPNSYSPPRLSVSPSLDRLDIRRQSIPEDDEVNFYENASITYDPEPAESCPVPVTSILRDIRKQSIPEEDENIYENVALGPDFVTNGDDDSFDEAELGAVGGQSYSPKVTHSNKLPPNMNFLPKEKKTEPVCKEVFEAWCAFKATEDGELTLTKGDHVRVITKERDGWWFVAVGEEKGYVPSNFLKRVMAEGSEGGKSEPSTPEVQSRDMNNGGPNFFTNSQNLSRQTSVDKPQTAPKPQVGDKPRPPVKPKPSLSQKLSSTSLNQDDGDAPMSPPPFERKSSKVLMMSKMFENK